MDSNAEVSSPPSRRSGNKVFPPKHVEQGWHQTGARRSRWMLHLQAVFWRVLMGLGMFFHRLAPPRPPKPDFVRQIPSTISGRSGVVNLHFYVPRDYFAQKALYSDRPWERADGKDVQDAEDSLETGKQRRISQTFSMVGQSFRRRSSVSRKWGGYPVVINFHGGGFTLGAATDDARWCGTVVNECQAVVISVEYRLAPEYPFPTAVEDGADALLWVHQHSEELGTDADKIAISGFSSGANMAVSVPMRLYDEIHGFPRNLGDETPKSDPNAKIDSAHGEPALVPSASSSSTNVNGPGHRIQSEEVVLDPKDPPPPLSRPGIPRQGTKDEVAINIKASDLPRVQVRCIMPWYPSLDYTRTREERRATCVRKDQELPAIFTNLFDESYLHPPQNIALDSPYLSPGIAPSELIENALPQDIILHTCEWDMLLDEGEAFKNRLVGHGKSVYYKMIEGVPHGWDKAPNPWKPTPGVREHYLRACAQLRRVFSANPVIQQLEERRTQDGPTAAPRGSIQVVR